MDDKEEHIEPVYLLQQLAFLIERQFDQILLEQLGIGFSQFKILHSLDNNPHLLQKEMAETLHQTEASISRQVKLLRSKGLLISKVNPKNRRQRLTVVTPKGLSITMAAQELLDKHNKAMLSSLTKKRQDTLVDILTHLDNHISPVKQAKNYTHFLLNVL